VRIWERDGDRDVKSTEVPQLEPKYAGHQWQVDEFLTWLDSGPEPDTVLADNIKSVATMFAAIRASEENTVVDVDAMVQEAMGVAR